MATYSCIAEGNAVTDRVRYIMLENLSIMLFSFTLKIHFFIIILFMLKNDYYAVIA